jgi:hypothetical protein
MNILISEDTHYIPIMLYLCNFFTGKGFRDDVSSDMGYIITKQLRKKKKVAQQLSSLPQRKHAHHHDLWRDGRSYRSAARPVKSSDATRVARCTVAAPRAELAFGALA